MPVVSGNVSLYNESDGRPIHPTPVVGCVGVVDDVRRVPGGWHDGDVVFLAACAPLALDGSEYQARFGEPGGRPARLDLAAEAALVAFLWHAAPQLLARPRRRRRRPGGRAGRGGARGRRRGRR